MVLVAAPGVKALCPDFTAPGQRLPVPLLTNEPNSIFRQQFEGYLREKDIRMDHIIQLGSIPTIQRLVENEVGVTFLPRFTVEGGAGRRPTGAASRGHGGPPPSPRCAPTTRGSGSVPLLQCFLDLVTQTPLL